MRFFYFLLLSSLVFVIFGCSSTKQHKVSVQKSSVLTEEDLNEILKIKPLDIDANIALNRELLKNKKNKKALEQAQKLIVKNPENYLGYYLAGITYMTKKDNLSALSTLQRAENEMLTDKTDKKILNDTRKRIALLFYFSGNLTDSEIYFDKCWNSIKKNGEIYYKRGNLQLKIGKKKEGITNIKKSMNSGYAEAFTLFNAVVKDHKEKVLLFYSECLNEKHDGCMNLFKTLSIDKNLNKAAGVDSINKIEALTQAASLGDVKAEEIFKKEIISKCDDSFSIESCFPSAVYYFKTKKFEKAISYMNKIVKNRPENPFWHYSLALFYAHFEKYELSAKELKTAIKIDSSFHETSLKELVLEKPIEIIKSEH